LSHKTGKRVLTASTSLALAVVGLAASPIAAHAAAANVQVVNVCGGALLDYITMPANSGTYTIKAVLASDADETIDTTLTTGALAGSETAKGASLLADGVTVKYPLPAGAFVTDVNNNSVADPKFAVYDSLGTRASLSTYDGATCAVQSVPAPTSNPSARTITVTKGSGLVWNVAAAAATSVVTDGPNTSNASKTIAATTNADLTWPVGSGPTATQTLTVTGTGNVTVSPTVDSLHGYTGPASIQNYVFAMDGKTPWTWTAPVVNDRDGIAADTVTLPNVPGITWYYKKATAAGAAAEVTARNADADSGNGAYVPAGYTAATTGAGGTVTLTRPASMLDTEVFVVVAVADATHKIDLGAGSFAPHKAASTAAFTNTVYITSVPAPTMVDGPGPSDYYILPSVPGIKWQVTGVDNQANPIPQVDYPSGDPRLGQQIPVYTSNPPVTLTFTAVRDANATTPDGTVGGYQIDATKVTKTSWSQKFDNRASVVPVAPQFVDKTGLVDDAVIFPALQAGLDGYKFAVTTSSSGEPADAGNPGDYKYADYTWYGKTVTLTDLQKSFTGSVDPTKTKVWVKVAANGTTYVLATDAAGNAVTSKWNYVFTNSVNIVPAAPTQTAVAGDPTKYTLTFPVDEKVIYSVTDASGITKDIAYGDLGKPLTYSGTTTVRARAASSIYTIQPNADGTAPAPWTFLAPSATIKPQAPTMSNPAGTANDTYTLPAQTGIVWNVDGKDVPLSAYGSPISTGGATKVIVIAQAGAGYALDSTAQAKWTLDFGNTPPTNAQVDNSITSDAPPTAEFSWSADGATSYDVTYHKTLLNGSAGPEIDWKMDTTDTSANFVAEAGDEYTVTVVAKNDNGDASAVSSTVKFPGGSPIGDVTTGQGSFSAGWNLLGKSQLGGLPYYGDTAALASNGATWTYTVPAGTKSFDLFATVHSLGAKGKIWVNGVNWADFETNPSYWGTVSNPYGYPVRRVQGWDNTKSATITVQQTEGGNLYLALDAYRVNK
jgi:hypothetical protein